MSEVMSMEWTDQRVSRFWDYWTRDEFFKEQYFAKQVGKDVVRFLECAESLRGKRILDYGAGPGYLMSELIERGGNVVAADYSKESVDRQIQEFSGVAGFDGAVLVSEQGVDVEDSGFDIVACLETVEHVNDVHLETMLSEFSRVLCEGGLLLITTPNSEKLDSSKCFCPACEHVFHRVQHVRSWASSDLSQATAAFGFTPVFCQGVNFSSMYKPRITSLLDCSMRQLSRTLKDAIAAVGDAVSPRTFPHGRLLQRRVTKGRPAHLAGIFRKD